MRQLRGDKNKILSNHSGLTRLNSARPVRLSRDLTGFTLIELLVSVFIIGLISAVFMVNYHSTSQRSGLNVARQKLASDIRLAQNYCLGSKTYDGANSPSGGWGVHFSTADPTHYIIFADKDGDHLYNYDASKDLAKETKTLPAGVTISSLSPANTVDIIFFPPNPDIYINALDVFNRSVNSASIVLRENINNSTGTVTVNYFGLIDTR